MLRWILLLGILVIGGVLWSTRLPPSVSVELPDPPKAEPVPVLQPIVKRLFGLWSTPDSHFWSDNLRVGPPNVTRTESVPHGPMVGEQAGWTRPIESSHMSSSAWTEWLRRTLIGTGISNPLDKSFASSGVLERSLCGALCPSVPPAPSSEPDILDGTGGDGTTVLLLDGQGPNNPTPTDVYTGGNVYGDL